MKIYQVWDWLLQLHHGAGWFSWLALLSALALAVVVFDRTWQKVSVSPDARRTDPFMTALLAMYASALWWLTFTWLAGVPVLSTVLKGSTLSIAVFFLYQTAKEVLYRMLPPMRHPHTQRAGHR